MFDAQYQGTLTWGWSSSWPSARGRDRVTIDLFVSKEEKQTIKQIKTKPKQNQSRTKAEPKKINGWCEKDESGHNLLLSITTFNINIKYNSINIPESIYSNTLSCLQRRGWQSLNIVRSVTSQRVCFRDAKLDNATSYYPMKRIIAPLANYFSGTNSKVFERLLITLKMSTHTILK